MISKENKIKIIDFGLASNKICDGTTLLYTPPIGI